LGWGGGAGWGLLLQTFSGKKLWPLIIYSHDPLLIEDTIKHLPFLNENIKGAGKISGENKF
jgi:hypothetical protein